MRIIIVAALVAASAVALFSMPAASIEATGTTIGPRALDDAVPLVVRSGQAHVIGRPAATSRLHFTVTLKIRSWGKLNRALAAESTPGTRSFGHYLTQSQANRLFNPTLSQQNRVIRWLQSNRITVIHTSVNHLVVDARGSAGAVDRAFHIAILRYSGNLYGKAAHFFAPSTAPIIPAALSGILNGVVGLDSTTRIFTRAVHPLTPVSLVRPRGTSDGGYFPADYRAAYGVPSAETGAGQHIGITLFDDPPSNASLSKWARRVGFGASGAPTTTNGRLQVHLVHRGVKSGDSGESGIDVENSYGLAPGAVIDYWEFNDQTQSPDGALDALNGAGTTGPKALGFNGLPIERQISSSWGLCEDSGDDASNEDPVMASNSATGHAYLFASGDTGSYCPEYANAGRDDPYPQYPASSPYVTSVGGTAFGPGSHKYAPITLTQYPGEVAWYYVAKEKSDQCYSSNVACPSGSSGGYSNRYARPPWEKAPGLGGGTGSCTLTGGKHICRAFPDVSAAGDPDYSGSFICYSAGCEIDGGTSVASPIWAGILADINSYLVARDLVLGFANPALYYLANQSTYHADFHDIVCPNAATRKDGGCTNGKFATGNGWDAVTGLGSPNVANLEADLAR